MVARSVLARSALGLAIYSLCVVFVFSFILFEVLDVDGSDFPSSATQAIAAEAPHADIRRTFDPALDPIVPAVAAAVGELDRTPEPVVTVVTPPSVPRPPRLHRRLLARAALADVPPSA